MMKDQLGGIERIYDGVGYGVLLVLVSVDLQKYPELDHEIPFFVEWGEHLKQLIGEKYVDSS